jgi:hypothetical protein
MFCFLPESSLARCKNQNSCTGCLVMLRYLQVKPFVSDIWCKVLLNKDHATCGKERFIGTRPQGRHSWVQSEAAWLKMGNGLYRRGQAMRAGERVSGLWWSVITRWNRSTCLASWVTGSSWVVLQTEKQSGREKQAVISQRVWFQCLPQVLSPAPRMPGT